MLYMLQVWDKHLLRHLVFTVSTCFNNFQPLHNDKNKENHKKQLHNWSSHFKKYEWSTWEPPVEKGMIIQFVIRMLQAINNVIINQSQGTSFHGKATTSSTPYTVSRRNGTQRRTTWCMIVVYQDNISVKE